jgi:serine/threonine protein kinase
MESFKNPTDTILGLLYHWIEGSKTLTRALKEQTSPEVREKWASQIQETVSMLHKLGVVWGDVKADNVLIDNKGDAIVIDSGGGFTYRWVNITRARTVEGDLQGLGNLKDYILNEESALRPKLRS